MATIVFPPNPVEGQEHTGTTGKVWVFTQGTWVPKGTGVEEAPTDGQQYGRQNSAWTTITQQAAAIWGNITGALSDQTDLQAALDAKENAAGKGAANGYAPLDATSRVPAENLSFTGLNYVGQWNAATNTPTLPDGNEANGRFYIVSVAGATNLDGVTNWGVGDWAIHNGTVYQRIPASSAVVSVHGRIGAVVGVVGDYTPAQVGAVALAGDIMTGQLTLINATAGGHALNRQTADDRYGAKYIVDDVRAGVVTNVSQEICRWPANITDSGTIIFQVFSFPNTTAGGVLAQLSFAFARNGTARLVVHTNVLHTNWMRDLTLTSENNIWRLNMNPNATGAFTMRVKVDSMRSGLITDDNAGDDATGTVRATADLNANVP